MEGTSVLAQNKKKTPETKTAAKASSGEQSVLGAAKKDHKPVTFYKKAWFWIIIAVVVLGIAGLITFLVINANLTAEAIKKFDDNVSAANKAVNSFESSYSDIYSESGLAGYYSKSNDRSISLRNKCLEKFGGNESIINTIDKIDDYRYMTGEEAVDEFGFNEIVPVSATTGTGLEKLAALLTSYLPDYADSKKAINMMKDTFGYPGTGRIMLKDVSLYEAKQYKNQMEKVEGVDQIIWCDLVNQVYSSSDFIDYTAIDEYYKDNCAVMDVTFTEGDTSRLTHRAIDDIEEILGDRGYIVGMSPTNKFTEENVQGQMKMILAVAVTFIFLILLATTTSYFEPVLFLTVIGCAIAINKGTNLALGEISFVTNNIADVMQLATSMDYSVFLLHAYERERENGLDKEAAMKEGLKNTINTVLASSLTTFCGFIVLITMQFKMGWDLGIVMSKSIICSLLMVIFLMPALLLRWSDRIDRTRHRPFLPRFHRFSIVVNRLSPYVLALVLLIAAPCYVAQGMNNFMYGPDAVGAGPGVSIYENAKEIDEKFGRSNLIVAIFPTESDQKERQVADELKELPYVKNVMTLAAYLPEGVPESMLPKSITKLFHQGGYTRALIYIKTKPESALAYKDTLEVSQILRSYYPEECYITGNTPSTMDMENILKVDYQRVNNLAMLGVFVVVMMSFHSPVMPLVTMIPIMIAIYLNMAFPYIVGKSMIFIGYAVVSCIQLGATIDYAILCTENYMHVRRTEEDKKEASRAMVELSFPSILTSGTILIVCGYAISYLSSIPAISEVGRLVGRGAIFSVVFVTTTMPVLLRLVDHFIMTPAAEKRRERPST